MSRIRRSAFLVALLAGCCAGRAVAQADTAPSFPGNARIGDLEFIENAPIPDIVLPAAAGGNIDSRLNGGELSDYSFDPARLPAGLSFDRFTRVLSGTPTAALGKRTYHFWVHDDDENWAVSDADSVRFSIEVVSEDRSAAVGGGAFGSPGDSAPGRLGDGAAATYPGAASGPGNGAAVTNPGAATIPGDFSASFETEFQWFNRDRPPAFSGAAAWTGVAWRGESLHKQILVAGASPPYGFAAAASDFRTQAGDVIPADAVSFRYPEFAIGDIEGRGCGEYSQRDDIAWLADALSAEPPGGLPRSWPAMIWMSIDVPSNAPPGEYAGTIAFRSRPGDETVLHASLQVTPWRIPPVSERQFHLDLWQFPVSVLDRYHDAHPVRRIAPWSEPHYRLLEPFYRYLARMGQRAVSAYIKEGAHGAPSMIRWIALDNGKRWAYDYSAFDAHVERLAAWGIDGQIDAFSVVGWNKDEIPFWDEVSGEDKVLKAPVGSQTYNALWNHFLTDFKGHLLDKGWFEKTVLYMDEVPQEEMEAAIALIRYNDERWKIGLAYGHAPDDRVIRSLYDVSGYYESEIDVETYDHQLTTFYTSCTTLRPNNYVAANGNPADMAAMPWYAMNRGHDGYLRWAFDNWKAYDPLDLRDGANTAGDFSFVYRSSNDLDMTVVPSVRSELLRDGIEDFEKLRVLQDALGRCARQDVMAELDETIEMFSTEALLAGEARRLVTAARETLDDLSSRPALVECP